MWVFRKELMFENPGLPAVLQVTENAIVLSWKWLLLFISSSILPLREQTNNSSPGILLLCKLLLFLLLWCFYHVVTLMKTIKQGK